jgi:hypothetical protein
MKERAVSMRQAFSGDFKFNAVFYSILFMSSMISLACFSNAIAEEVILKPLAGSNAVYTASPASNHNVSDSVQVPSNTPVFTPEVKPQEAVTPTMPQNWDEPILRGKTPDTASTIESGLSQASSSPSIIKQSESASSGDSTSGANQALQITTATEKVPTGTVLKIAFNTPMDSRVSLTGEPFTATLQEDFYTLRRVDGEPEKRVILPQGTMLRGRASDVKRPGLFSKGGAISLSFDHVVLPSGELLPLAMNLSNTNPIVNQAGALYTDPGVGKKVNQGVQKGFFTFNKVKDATVKAGADAGGDLGKIFAAPFAVAGGAVASGAVITGKTVVAIVGKGDSVVINPGDTLSIDFAGAFNLPSQ